MIPIIRDSMRFADQVIGFNGSTIITANNGNNLASHIFSNIDVWQKKVDALIEIYK